MAKNDKSTVPPPAKITEDSTFDNDVFSFQPHLGSEQTGFSTAEKVISFTVSVSVFFLLFAVQCYNSIWPPLPTSPQTIFLV